MIAFRGILTGFGMAAIKDKEAKDNAKMEVVKAAGLDYHTNQLPEHKKAEANRASAYNQLTTILGSEEAADYLRVEIGQKNEKIEWVAVRPDALIDDENVTEYKCFPSPIRSAIFDPGKTSRINVGHFMAQLTINDDLWKKWKGKMPAIYNSEYVK